MRKKIAAAVLAFIICISVLLGCAIAAGSSTDPLITLHYLNSTVKTALINYINEKTNLNLTPIEHDLYDQVRIEGQNALDSIDIENLAGNLAWDVLDEISDDITLPAANSYRLYELADGVTITAREGAAFYVISGSIDAVADTGNVIIDLRNAYEYGGGWVFSEGDFLLVGENSTYTLDASYTSATVYISGDISIKDDDLYKVQYRRIGEALRDMGLFKGTDLGFELERRPLRNESLTMLVRLLGAESAAQGFGGTPSFNDIAPWFVPYVNYAYTNGLTLGMGDNMFGSRGLTTANQYMTFILRSLGYSDSGDNPDFDYRTAIDDALRLGVLYSGEADTFKTTPFRRDQMVYMSYLGLLSKMKSSETTLLQSLIDKGAVDASSAEFWVAYLNLRRR